MSNTEKVKATVLSDFNDAGTEEKFQKGQNIELDAGVFANYEVGGLVAKAGTTEARGAKSEANAEGGKTTS